MNYSKNGGNGGGDGSSGNSLCRVLFARWFVAEKIELSLVIGREKEKDEEIVFGKQNILWYLDFE